MPIAPPPVVHDEHRPVEVHRGHEPVEVADEVRELVVDPRLVAPAHADQIDGDRPMVAGHGRQHVAPQVARRGVAVHEHHRRPVSGLDVVDLRARDLNVVGFIRKGGRDPGFGLHLRHEFRDRLDAAGEQQDQGQGERAFRMVHDAALTSLGDDQRR
jgi:hypothetical protein